HKRHPKEMGNAEIEAFLTHLAVEGQVSASTQNQALRQCDCPPVGWVSLSQPNPLSCSHS
ncbi:MAG: phage integrase N-terminal SAM-like domain-containing protein, partial [Leptolyngbyaceae cyanobacterium]